MSLYFALRDLASLPQLDEKKVQAIEQHLLKMVRVKGLFPNSLKLQEGLRALALMEKTKPDAMAKLVCVDPILSLRLISTMTNAFYQRSTDITTVLAAVNHIGLSKVPEVAAETGEAKSYRALFLGRAVSALVYQEMVFAAILSRRVATILAPREGLDGLAYVLSILSRLGPTLLAYHKPNIYSAMFIEHIRTQGQSLEKSFKKITGKSTGEIGVELAKTLTLPKKILIATPLVNVAPWHKRVWGQDEGRDIRMAVGAVFIANKLVSVVSDFSGAETLSNMVEDMASRINISPDIIGESVGESLSALIEHLHELGFSGLRLPFYLEKYMEPIVERDGTINTRNIKWPGLAERINSFINEIRACLKTEGDKDDFYRLPQAVLCTLRGLLHGMNFDFATFMRFEKNENALIPTVWLGQLRMEGRIDEVVRKMIDANSLYMPDLQAMIQKKSIFAGDPLIENHYPFAAFPAIARGEVVGVFYAHKNPLADAAPLDTQEQVAVIALAEEWHDIPSGFY